MQVGTVDARRMGLAARASAERLAWDAVIDQVEALFHAVVSGSHGVPDLPLSPAIGEA